MSSNGYDDPKAKNSTDIYSATKRSEIMSKISGKDTKPELIVRKYLFSKGFRFRLNDKRYPGKPDIILPMYKTAIFVHGCFWHGHEGCKASRLPQTRKEFWEKKINDTKVRDKRNIRELKEQDWKVLIIWQCKIKNKKDRESYLEEIVRQILD
ncbi:MAG: DNA mismatch endonuclease Vsr [bacterium]|nr:DNA mismatch endonuclease Vsr [bacterium]